MAVPGVPLPDPVVVGQTGHAQMHQGANEALNYLTDAATLAARVFASPAGAPGAPDLIALGAAHIAAALQDIQAGAVGTPAIAFNGDPDTGLFRIAANSLGVAAGGVQLLSATLNGTAREINLGDGVGSTVYRVNGAAGSDRDTTFQSGGSSRWIWRVNSTAEGGSNAGSNMVLLSRTDAGASLNANVISINRATGHVGINTPPTTTPARHTVVGTVDEVQEIVRAHSTQTADIHQWQTSAGANLVRLAGQGLLFPVQFTTVGAPAWAAGLIGSIWFDTTINKLMIGGAAGWEVVTST